MIRMLVFFALTAAALFLIGTVALWILGSVVWMFLAVVIGVLKLVLPVLIPVAVGYLIWKWFFGKRRACSALRADDPYSRFDRMERRIDELSKRG